ncbi:MAG: peptide ABC transporter substrate-binding protein, partial [Clostridia bacterium]|nr:peptide ABC transporter substrate-binding protein [Clostridia bacterium]
PKYTPEKVDDFNGLTDAQIYDKVLGEFYNAYSSAKNETSDVAKRFALMAIAEAKLMESGVMLPMQANGGNYAIGKTAPYSAPYAQWGNDYERYHNIIVVTSPIKNDDRNALRSLWAEKKGTGTYEAEAIKYLEGKGYTLQHTYSFGYSSDPETYDTFMTSNAADSEVLINTYDGLIEYNNEGTLVGMLAKEWGASDDGLTWTFKLREGVKWVDSTGAELGEVTSDDFLAGFQHMLDDPEGGLSWLVEGIIAKASEYISGEASFDEVGVKAPDKYTVEYHLEAPCSYFETMFGYSVFAPLLRSYFTSQGGTFGDGATAGTYGTDKDHIAYCGPYIITTAVSKNSFVFTKNESYWNKDKVLIDKITWVYNDGTNATQAYDDYTAGVIDACGLNSAALKKARDDKKDDYIYTTATDSTSFPAFFNVYRRGYANMNDETKGVSTLSEDQKKNANLAMASHNFRLALAMSFDRAAFQAQSVGDELKYVSLVNSYTPGTFVSLPSDVTVSINGTNKTYKAGTWYGQIMQDQITADGYPMKVFDPSMENGVGSSSGFDGWYNVEEARKYLANAIEDLKASGLEVTTEKPIVLEYPYQEDGDVSTARANVLKRTIEESLQGLVKIQLVAFEQRVDYLYAGYYFKTGSQANYNLSTLSGWGPDYGDPSTYLDTMIKNGGYMLKCLGLEA